MTTGMVALQQSLLRRALTARDGGRLHVRFDAGVVDRYRGMPSAQVMRTRTVGRIAIPGRWTLDFGIVDGEDIAEGFAAGGAGEVHVPFQDLVDRLPENEWEHWIAHLAPAPASAAFIQMRMTPSACIDDGETRDWE
jgi:hypothetical protein